MRNLFKLNLELYILFFYSRRRDEQLIAAD